MRELQPDGQWPLWTVASELGMSESDGYGGIACYVPTAQVLENRLGFRPGRRIQLADLPPEERDRRTVELLLQDLAERNIAYADPPRDPAEGQRIRDAEWLLRRWDPGSGTCIDLSLLFAGLCLNERLDTFLLMLRGTEKSHVAVAVRLGSNAASDAAGAKRRVDGPRPYGVAASRCDGVLSVVAREAFIDDSDILLIDPTVATTVATSGVTDRSLAAATKKARTELCDGRYQVPHLVDVAVRQLGYGDLPLEPPTRRGALRGRIALPAGFRDLEGHTEARASLRGANGKIVIRGPQGVGKSTLARLAAARADNGHGWFLPASSAEAFQTALAAAELGERGQPVRQFDAVEREGLAREALERLRRSDDSWVIVLDNANNGAQPFEAVPAAIDRLPSPKRGQLIIATSTAEPGSWQGWQDVMLPAVTEEDLTELGDQAVAGLAAGRPLLMDAFTRLLTANPDARDQLLEGHPVPGTGTPPRTSDAAARRSAALYWATARGSLTTAAVASAERLAWLPPDLLKPGAAGEDDPTRAELRAFGLLAESATPGAAAVHRLFGEAIRAAVAAEGRAEQTVRELLALPAARETLLQYGDAEVVREITAAVAETSSGLTLWALGMIQEVHLSKVKTVQQISLSAETFALAASKLDPPSSQAEADALADCLHAAGRVINQGQRPNRPEIDAAIGDMQRAISLRDPSDLHGIAKHQALFALLRQRGAKFITDREEKLRELNDVRDILEQSWRLRSTVLPENDPEVDRAYFNRAGIRTTLAKEIAMTDPDTALAYLREVREVYLKTLEFRRSYYHGPNPITAASINGLAIWGYESVRLAVAEDASERFRTSIDLDPVLQEAFDKANEAQAMRRQTSIIGDVAKSASMLTRLGALQFKLASTDKKAPRGRPEQPIAEAANELHVRAEVLGQLGVTGERLRDLGLTDEQIRALGLEPPGA
jgi:hypothetical protein